MSRENLPSLTPVTEQLLADTQRIDTVLDSFIAPPADIALRAPAGEMHLPKPPAAEAEHRPSGVERNKKNLARRTRQG